MASNSQKLVKTKEWLKKAAVKAQGVILNKTATALLAERAVNGEPWGPHGQDLGDLANACHDGEAFTQVWAVLLKRLTAAPGAEWRRTYKALLVVQHLVTHSSQFAVQFILDNGTPVIEALLKYEYKDDAGKDQGINVRNRSKELLYLLESADRIREARAKAKAAKAKFTGVGSQELLAQAASATGPAGAQTVQDLGAARAAGDTLKAPSQALDPVAATAQRIRSLKESTADRGVDEKPVPATAAPISFEAFPNEGSAEDLAVALSARSASGMPSLRDLTDSAARRGGPRKLKDVAISGAIASSLGGLKLGPAVSPLPAPARGTSPVKQGVAATAAILIAPSTTADAASGSPTTAGASPCKSHADAINAAALCIFGGGEEAPLTAPAVAGEAEAEWHLWREVDPFAAPGELLESGTPASPTNLGSLHVSRSPKAQSPMAASPLAPSHTAAASPPRPAPPSPPQPQPAAAFDTFGSFAGPVPASASWHVTPSPPAATILPPAPASADPFAALERRPVQAPLPAAATPPTKPSPGGSGAAIFSMTALAVGGPTGAQRAPLPELFAQGQGPALPLGPPPGPAIRGGSPGVGSLALGSKGSSPAVSPADVAFAEFNPFKPRG